MQRTLWLRLHQSIPLKAHAHLECAEVAHNDRVLLLHAVGQNKSYAPRSTQASKVGGASSMTGSVALMSSSAVANEEITLMPMTAASFESSRKMLLLVDQSHPAISRKCDACYITKQQLLTVIQVGWCNDEL